MPALVLTRTGSSFRLLWFQTVGCRAILVNPGRHRGRGEPERLEVPVDGGGVVLVSLAALAKAVGLEGFRLRGVELPWQGDEPPRQGLADGTTPGKGVTCDYHRMGMQNRPFIPAHSRLGGRSDGEWSRQAPPPRHK